jgi:hypothetical protein
MTDEQALELVDHVSWRLYLLLQTAQDPTDQQALKAARLHVKRAYCAVWAALHPLPNSGRELADDAELYRGLRELGVKY